MHKVNFSPTWKIKHFEIRAIPLTPINIRVVLGFLHFVNEVLCSLCSGNTFSWWCFPLAGKQIKGFSSWQILLSIGHNYWTYLKGSFYIFWPLTFVLKMSINLKIRGKFKQIAFKGTPANKLSLIYPGGMKNEI